MGGTIPHNTLDGVFFDATRKPGETTSIGWPVLTYAWDDFRLGELGLRKCARQQSDNDKTLGLCLQQIEESGPFLIGILGERYGCVPQGIDQQARSQYGWLQHYIDKAHELFLSYSHRELEKVRPIRSALERRGHILLRFYLKCLEDDDARQPEREDVSLRSTRSRTGQAWLSSAHLPAMRATRRSRVRNCTSMPLYFRVKAGRASGVVTSKVALG